MSYTLKGKPVSTHYSDRMCPELSKVSLARANSGLVGAEKSQATACQGAQCMWFIPETSPSGEIVNGACAITMNVILKLQTLQSAKE